MIPLWLKLTSTVIGTLLVVYGLFTVPSEQRRWENYLVRWWLWVEEKRESGLRWHTAFLQVITIITTRGFDRVFGPKLVSFEAAGASIALAMSLLCLGSAFLTVAFFHNPPVWLMRAAFVIWLCLSIGFGFIGLLRILRPQLVRFQFALAVFTLALLISSLILMDPVSFAQHPEVFIAILIALSISLVTDIFFVSFMRWLTRRAVNSSGFMSFMMILISLVMAVVVSLGAGFFLFLFPASKQVYQMVANYVFVMNLVDELSASAVVLLGIVMLLHRLIWPPISRLLEVLGDEHILLKRWPLFFAGVSILTATWAPLAMLARHFGLNHS